MAGKEGEDFTVTVTFHGCGKCRKLFRSKETLIKHKATCHGRGRNHREVKYRLASNSVIIIPQPYQSKESGPINSQTSNVPEQQIHIKQETSEDVDFSEWLKNIRNEMEPIRHSNHVTSSQNSNTEVTDSEPVLNIKTELQMDENIVDYQMNELVSQDQGKEGGNGERKYYIRKASAHTAAGYNQISDPMDDDFDDEDGGYDKLDSTDSENEETVTNPRKSARKSKRKKEDDEDYNPGSDEESNGEEDDSDDDTDDVTAAEVRQLRPKEKKERNVKSTLVSNPEVVDAYLEQWKDFWTIENLSEGRIQYRCLYCKKYYARGKKFIQKHLLEHNNGVLSCLPCGFHASNINEMKQHLETTKHTCPKPVQYISCGECCKMYTSVRTFKRHMELTHASVDQTKSTDTSLLSEQKSKKKYKKLSTVKIEYSSEQLEVELERFKAGWKECSADNGETMFMCLFCDAARKFKTKQLLMKHLLKLHDSTDPCATIREVETDLDRLKNYWTEGLRDDKPVYRCLFCQSYTVKTKNNLRRHLLKHDGGVLCCQECGYQAAHVSFMEEHVSTKHRHEYNFVCEECGQSFKRRSSLTLHKSKIHPETGPGRVCNICQLKKPTAKALRKHMIAEHNGEGLVMCDQCGDYFLTGKQLSWHRRMCHDRSQRSKVMDSACPFCARQFANVKRLTIHIKRIHEGTRNYRCKLCSFTSFTSTQLVYHMRKHTGERPYTCNLCTFSAAKKYQLTSHMRTHTGEKPFRCHLCSYASSWNCQLKVHMKIHEPTVYALGMPGINEETVNLTQLCQICSQKCEDLMDLNQHLRKKHSQEYLDGTFQTNSFMT